MATLQSRLAALITVIKQGQKDLRTLLTGTASGNLSGLNTAASDIVTAINNVETKADNAQSTADGIDAATLNDAATNTENGWSSSKIASELAAALATASADAQAQIVAALEGEDLSDIADAIAAAAAERADLATAASVTTLAATVANKANSADVYLKSELGNPDTDLVALWNAA